MSTLFGKSRPGRRAFLPPPAAGEAQPRIAAKRLRKDAAGLPEMGELELLRHFVGLSVKNHSIAKGFYPLGSCTMKYNPVLSEALAGLEGFTGSHPAQDLRDAQGNLELLWQLQESLAAITGLPAVALQSVAGAQGEFVGMLVARAYHESRGETRRKVLIPDSAHGTNPASVRMAGLETVTLASGEDGLVHLDALDAALDEDCAALMLTNPNTLGLFESDILEINDRVHEAGGLVYMDGANMNALLGRVRPGDIGFDIMHLNLHKTFATPHGGGGPGAGPVAVREDLERFLPGPRVEKSEEGFGLIRSGDSVGEMHAWWGNFGILVRALAYILRYGGDGLADISGAAVLNANYLQARLREVLDIPREGLCMHEFVASGKFLRTHGVRTLDVAKRLLDFGMHAPTVYFPLIVPEALMIEPTETETRETLDEFVDAMKQIVREAEENPELLTSAPHDTPVGRLDEAHAAKSLCVIAPCGAELVDMEVGS